ncbi:MAG: preprotein translocase subunit SecE [Mycoplasma sp.]|nr:preprotein translocase subunit SecE [Mycoplasma sp.]
MNNIKKITKPKKQKIKMDKESKTKINYTKPNKNKDKKEKTPKLKGFLKELKRVRWPSAEEAWKVFVISIIFVIISSTILLLITYSFTNLWTSMGVGIGA